MGDWGSGEMMMKKGRMIEERMLVGLWTGVDSGSQVLVVLTGACIVFST